MLSSEIGIGKAAAELPHSTLEVEAVAQDHFRDEMIGGRGDADAKAEVDLPLWRQIQIDNGKNLVLLEAGGQEVRGRTYGAVVFDPAGDFLREVIADFDVG